MRKNLIVNYLGAGVVAVAQVTAVPFYIRFLDRDGWGMISIILSWAAALLVLEGGVTLSISRHFAVTKGLPKSSLIAYLRRVERRYLLVSASCAVAGIGWESWRRGMFGSGIPMVESLDLVSLALSMTAAQIAGAAYRGALVGTGAHAQLNALLAVFSLSRHLLAVILAWKFHSVISVALAMTVVTLVEASARRVVAFRVLREFEGSPNFHIAAPLSAARGPVMLMAASVVGAAMAQADRFYLSGHLLPSDFGVYAVAATLSMSGLQLIYPISQALIPRLPEFSKGSPSKLLSRLRALLIAAIALSLLIVFLGGESALKWWLSDGALAVAVFPLLMTHLIGTSFNALCIPYHVGLLAEHKDKSILIINILALTIQLGTLSILYAEYGVIAGSISWILANIVTLLGYWIAKQK